MGKKIKIFFLLTATSSITLNICCAAYVHFSNNTDGKIEINAEYVKTSGRGKGTYALIKKEIANPYDTRFIKLDSNWVKAPGFSTLTVKSLDGKTSGIVKTLSNALNLDYHAYLIEPKTENEKPSFIIKQRSNKDAELILEKHKGPANPTFVKQSN